MEENIELKKDNKLENLIGILLIMPIYMSILMLIPIVLNLLGCHISGDNFIILFLLLIYLPIIIGMVLSYKNYNSKISKSIVVCNLVFLVIALHFFYQAYLVEHSGWDALGDFLLWLINTAILRICSCILYAKIVGWKKAIRFFIIYVLSVVSSFALGFWA